MDLAFKAQDIILIMINIASVATLFGIYKNKITNIEKNQAKCELEFKNQQHSIEKEITKLKNMIVTETGKQLYVDTDQCSKYQDYIYAAIRNGKDADEKQSKKIDKIMEYIIEIASQLKIKTDGRNK